MNLLPTWKVCPMCGKQKPARAFHVRTVRSGPRAGYKSLSSRCRPCNVAYRLAWVQRDTPTSRAYWGRHIAAVRAKKRGERERLGFWPGSRRRAFFSSQRRHEKGKKT